MLTFENYLMSTLYVLMPLLIGLVLGRIRPLEPLIKPTFRLLDVAVVWVILPAVVFVSVARCTPAMFRSFGGSVTLAVVGLGVCFLLATGISFARGLRRETTTAFALNSAFMNVGHLGLPVVYILGEAGVFRPTLENGATALSPAALYAVAVGVLNLVLGLVLVSSVKKRRVSLGFVLERMWTFPAFFALFSALLFVGFNAYLPRFIRNPFDDYLAKPFLAAVLLFAGYHLPIVSPRKYFRVLAGVGTLRFLVCPFITYLMIGLLGLNIATDSCPKPALVMAVMPPAIFNLILAHSFRLDLKLYGAVVFYLTFVSLFAALPLLIRLTF